MLIGSRQRLNTVNRLQSFTVDSNSVKQVEFTKSLEVYDVDENLTWNVHNEHTSKTNCLPYWHLEEKQVFCSFSALVHPHFDSCSDVV